MQTIFKFLLFPIFLIPATCTPRVVGGLQENDPSVIMWQAVFLRKGSLLCGGSLITHNKLLTAAHCDIHSNNNDYTVRIGGDFINTGIEFPVLRLFRHPAFGRFQSRPINDVMVVEFHNRDRTLGRWAPHLNPDPHFPSVDKLTTSGYGTTGLRGALPGHLRSVDVPLVPQEICETPYPGIRRSETLCAGDEMFDACKGDSGGPLWKRDALNRSRITLFGVVSFGHGCAVKGAPGVYSRVSGYYDWVMEVVRLDPTPYTPKRRPIWPYAVSIGGGIAVLFVVVIIVAVVVLVRRRREINRPETGTS